MTLGIVIQARMGSTRLPNKVLKRLPHTSNSSVIDQIIDRALAVKGAKVVVATTVNKSDDELVAYLSKRKDINVFRGSEDNVLSRYCEVAQKYSFDQVVRLTGDNPCIDPKAIEETIKNHVLANADYTYTIGYPLGMNIEVVAASALVHAQKEGVTKPDKEHVTYYIRQHPDLFNLNYLDVNILKQLSSLRLTLDTAEDYILIQLVFDFLYSSNNFFGIEEIEKLYNNSSYIFNLNSSVNQKQVFFGINDELKKAHELLEQQEMPNAANFIKRELEK